MNNNEATIEQINDVIADFMDLYKSEGSDFSGQSCEMWFDKKTNIRMVDGQLEYHTSWYALMAVVEKIHQLKEFNPDGKNLRLMSKLTVYMQMDGHYNRCSCSILGHITHCYTLSIPHNYKQVDLPSIHIHDKDTLIEAVYVAVYQFIQWYNQQTKPEHYEQSKQ